MTTRECTIKTPLGRLIYWQSEGTEFPVLMIHGSGASKSVFRHQFSSPLADRVRLIAVDLPGHGQSDDALRAEDYAIPNIAQRLNALTEALDLKHFAIYGWSLGGHLAIEMMASNPSVAGVMLGGAPPISRGPLGMLRAFHTGWDMLLVSKRQFNEHDVERFGRMCFGENPPTAFLDDIRRADGACRAAVARSMLRGEGVDQRRAVETASIPVAFANGEQERILRLSYLNSIECPMLWEATSHLIPNAAHSPFFQNPLGFNSLLERFTEDVARQVANPEAALVRRAG
jgi:pimeloyl-ACP methyl ester carboxylesterase